MGVWTHPTAGSWNNADAPQEILLRDTWALTIAIKIA
jgi:hypothetical protein